MATITEKIFTCDVCGNTGEVQTWAFGFDGRRYEIDLCPKDSDGLNKVVAEYAPNARKVTAKRGQRRNSHRPKASRPAERAAKASGARAQKEAGAKRSQPPSVMAAPQEAATPSPSQPPSVMAAPEQAATASGSQPPSVMATPQQPATPSSSQPQKAKAAPKKGGAAGRAQSEKAKAPPKQAATANRSQPQKAKTAAKQAATANRSQAQKAKAAPGQSANAGRSQSQKAEAALKQAATVGRSQSQKAKAALKQAATVGRSQLQKATAAPKRADTTNRSAQKAKAAPKRTAGSSGVQQEKGIYVYGVLPADIELADEIQGVGEHPGPLGVVYSDGLAALISEVDHPGRLGSPEDLRTHREILDSTAIDLPVVPLRFGTVFTGEDSVADELLVPRHDEFATALEQLEGRAQVVVRGRYVEEGPTDTWEEDTRALQQAMAGVSVDSVVHAPAQGREVVHVAFLIDVDQERDVERVVDDLGREWAGRIEIRLLGPMAAYDFVMTDSD